MEFIKNGIKEKDKLKMLQIKIKEKNKMRHVKFNLLYFFSFCCCSLFSILHFKTLYIELKKQMFNLGYITTYQENFNSGSTMVSDSNIISLMGSPLKYNKELIDISTQISDLNFISFLILMCFGLISFYNLLKFKREREKRGINIIKNEVIEVAGVFSVIFSILILLTFLISGSILGGGLFVEVCLGVLGFVSFLAAVYYSILYFVKLKGVKEISNVDEKYDECLKNIDKYYEKIDSVLKQKEEVDEIISHYENGELSNQERKEIEDIFEMLKKSKREVQKQENNVKQFKKISEDIFEDNSNAENIVNT